jgi:hypothetical protein
MIFRSSLSQMGMTNSGLHITQLATVVVPVSWARSRFSPHI